jgi:hypothetical protein
MSTKKLRLACVATIQHLNTRKEGPDDDKELACDLKLSTTVNAGIFEYFDAPLGLTLYTPEGAARNLMIGAIPFTHELMDYRLTMNGVEQYGVKVKKFQIHAMDGFKAQLSFSVSFKPTGTEVATLAEFLQDDIDLTLEPANEELDLGGKEYDDSNVVDADVKALGHEG